MIFKSCQLFEVISIQDVWKKKRTSTLLRLIKTQVGNITKAHKSSSNLKIGRMQYWLFFKAKQKNDYVQKHFYI